MIDVPTFYNFINGLFFKKKKEIIIIIFYGIKFDTTENCGRGPLKVRHTCPKMSIVVGGAIHRASIKFSRG